MADVILERSFEPPLTEERHAEFSARLSPCLARSGVTWIRSHLSLDRTRLICVFRAPDAGSVRNALRQARLEHDRVWSAEIVEP
jgi:DNA mismatch repair protein MutH